MGLSLLANPFFPAFWSSPKIPLKAAQDAPQSAQHPLEAAGWDEELSNIDPQAVYHTAWGDFGLRPRCPSHSTPLEGAGWDEELSNIGS